VAQQSAALHAVIEAQGRQMAALAGEAERLRGDLRRSQDMDLVAAVMGAGQARQVPVSPGGWRGAEGLPGLLLLLLCMVVAKGVLLWGDAYWPRCCLWCQCAQQAKGWVAVGLICMPLLRLLLPI
jgi:hypothetical protein